MAVNRLLQTLFILLEKGRTTAPELAEQFEVSVRTIYRDLDQLSAAGIPVYATQGKGGGIFLPDQYVLNKSLISETEQKQILMALEGLNLAGLEGSNTLLAKLGGVFQKQQTNWIELDFSGWNPDDQDISRILQQAIFQSRVIRFCYYSQKGSSPDRSVQPLKLVYKDQSWYLYAYCLLRSDYRLFKLSRIKELQVTDQEFIRAAPEKIFEQSRPDQARRADLTLRFDKTAAYRIYDHFDHIKETADGGYLVYASLPDHDSLYRFLLSFGDQVQVLAPPDIRRIMKEKISNMQNLYL